MHTDAFVPALAWALPFVGLLLSIAVLPLAAPHFWESNLRKLGVCALLGAPVLVLYLRAHPPALVHAAGDYVSFIVLLGGLFVISGGILLEGDLEATPRTNAAFLAVGALLASFVGTTGASMLLIRPLLQTNRERKHVAHTVVFFIFLVSNIGGCLTPLGDPPLFLGYLLGVPFPWTFRLFVPWLFTTALVLAVYFVWDRRAYAARRRATCERDFYEVRPLAVAGKENLVLLAGVVAAVAFLEAPWREVAIVALAGLSYARTDPALRKANHFTLPPDPRGGGALRRHLRHDAARPRPPAGAGRRAGRPRAVAVLLGDRGAQLLPRQRADVPDLPRPSPRASGLPADVRRRAARRSSRRSASGRCSWARTPTSATGRTSWSRRSPRSAGVKMPSFFGYMLYSGGILSRSSCW